LWILNEIWIFIIISLELFCKDGLATEEVAARRCFTLLDAARRCSTLLDAARRCSTLTDADRR
jgi:hypothetical protein